MAAGQGSRAPTTPSLPRAFAPGSAPSFAAGLNLSTGAKRAAGLQLRGSGPYLLSLSFGRQLRADVPSAGSAPQHVAAPRGRGNGGAEARRWDGEGGRDVPVGLEAVMGPPKPYNRR